MTSASFTTQIRPDRAVISISGDGVLTWLHNLLTCDVEHLAVGAAAYGALLSPQGKILHDMFVFNAGERVLIDCAEPHCVDLLRRLTLYKLRAKLSIAAESGLAAGASPEAIADSYADPRHPGMGWRTFVGRGAASADYDRHRIALGLADSVQDIGVENVFPHEANFDQFGGVSFTKGCFVGQEVVSRMQHRGTARNRFLPVTLDGALGGDRKITADGTPIGDITSVAGDMALALIRIDRLAAATGPLTAGDTGVTVRRPDWISS